MKRWGQIKGDVDYKTRGRAGVPRDRHRQADEEMGLPAPDTTYKSFTVMGKTFDPGKPEEYVQSFAIKRA